MFAALRAGASGFLTKEVEPRDLRKAIEAVASGEALLSPSVTRRVVGTFVGRPAPRAVPAPDTLTARELEVVGLVAGGLDNAAIAERLVISPHTAKTHVTRVLGKLGLRDRVQLVIWAYGSGLVQPGS